MMNASTYFCIFVLPFQKQHKVYYLPRGVFFLLQLSKRIKRVPTLFSSYYISTNLILSAVYSISIHTVLYNRETLSDIFYNIWILLNCVTVLIITSFQPNEITLAP